MDENKPTREELLQRLREKTGRKKMERSTKISRTKEFEKGLKESGIDVEAFKKDLEALKEQGGFTVKL